MKSRSGLMVIAAAGLSMLCRPALANVSYYWVTTGFLNLDPFSKVLPPYINLELTVTDTAYASGSASGISPPCGFTPGCGILPQGVLSVTDWGNGYAAMNITFDQSDPYLSGSIQTFGLDEGYNLQGAGDQWSGFVAGDNPAYGQACVGGTPYGTGCYVTGYWIDGPGVAVPEPSGLALLATGLFAIGGIRISRRFRGTLERQARV